MKTCLKCHKEKESDQFYKQKSNKDGLQKWCKSCHLEWYRIYRKTDKHLDYRRKHYKTKKVQDTRKKYYSRKDIKKIRAKYQREYRNNPDQQLKNYCRRASHAALRKGLIKKSNCHLCGSIKSEMHHDNYFEPLKIKWLCKSCHGAIHRKEEIVKC